MASEERIDSFIDLAAVKKEYDSFAALLADLKSAFDKLNNTKISLQKSGDSGKDIVKGMQDAAKATGAYGLKVAQVAEASSKLTAVTKEVAGAIVAETQAIGKLNDSYQQLIKTSVENQLASKKLSDERRQLNKDLSDGKVTQDKYVAGLEKIKAAELAISNSNA